MGVNGDSNTCFDVGYNQVYSPWSNPPLPVSNSNDSITIEITGRNPNGTLSLEIYFTNILGASPSKPQGLYAIKSLSDEQFNPRLHWNRNLEPDMDEYKIYRGTYSTPGGEPSSYEYIATTSDTTYLDESIDLYTGIGGSGPCTYYIVRLAYKITAVDNTSKESVKSERANIEGYSDPCGEIDPRPINGNNITSFKLYENYPNPFNPSTEIRFDLPEAVFVTLKVYDITGKEVAELVNEVKEMGSYSVRFNASNLSSGVYYYKLKAGNFSSVRKMLLIK